MNKLTMREKILLSILFILVILAVSINFFIKPALIEIKESNAKIQQLENEIQSNKAIIDQLPFLNDKIKEVNSNIESQTRDFYTPLKTWEAEEIITSIANRNNISFTLLLIGSNVITSNEISGEQSDVNTENQQQSQSNSEIIQIKNLNISFKCNTKDLTSFLDEIASLTTKMAISNWDYKVVNGKLEGNMLIKIYCIAE